MQPPKKRLRYSALNLGASWLYQIVMILLRFVNRAVFVRVLAQEYLGLSGLFSDVLAFLSLAELGVGGAIAYHLYRPLAQNDQKAVAALMNLYRRIYNVIGVFILLAGAAITPLLPYLIKDMPDIPHLSLIFLLFVLNSAVSYFFSYKGTLLSADQHNYLGTLIGIGTTFATAVLQIILLLTTGNYILYLLAAIVLTLAGNLVLSALVDRRYPFLRTDRKSLPSKESVGEIWRYTRAMMLHKVGGMAVLSTDNMIISKFIGLIIGGAYSNYVLLSKCLSNIVSQVFGAVGASVGNVGATEPMDKQKRIFNRLFLFNFWGYSYGAVGLACVSTPLIMLCFGRQFELQASIPVLAAISFYLMGMRKTVQTFNDGCGMLRHNRYAPLVEAVINLAVSIWLVQKIGLEGVIIGTIISTLCVPFWVEPFVLYRFHFKEHVLPYMGKLLGRMLLTLGEGLLCWKLCSLVSGSLLMQIVVRILICTVVCNGINLLFFARTEEFRFYWQLLGRFASRLRQGKRHDT